MFGKQYAQRAKIVLYLFYYADILGYSKRFRFLMNSYNGRDSWFQVLVVE